MLQPQWRNPFGGLSASRSIAATFQHFKRQTAVAGFLAYAGIISATLGLRMWLWRDTTLKNKTLMKIVGTALVLSGFFLYQHFRRGFGTFFLILASTGIGIAVYSNGSRRIHGNLPEIPAIVLIATGLIVYLAQTLSILGFLLLFASCATIVGFLWFNPAFVSPIVMVAAGGILVFIGTLIRFLALLNSFI